MGDSVYGSEGFYYGERSSFNPYNGNYVGYRLNQHGLGFPGSPQTANQVDETVKAIKQGVTAFEVTMLDANKSETIPKEHFKEMRQLMKISGVRPSMHAPIIDPSGFSKEGGYKDETRIDNERRMYGNIQKAYELDPKGNTPVVFHSTGVVPGADWRKNSDNKVEINQMPIVNRDTGIVTNVATSRLYNPLRPKSLENGGEKYTVEEKLDTANHSEWRKKIEELTTLNKHASDLIGYDNPAILAKYANQTIYPTEDGKYVAANPKNPSSCGIALNTAQERDAYQKIQQADVFIDSVQLNFNDAFEKAYQFGTDDQKKDLKKLAEQYSNNMNKIANNGPTISAPIEKQHVLNNAIEKLKLITAGKSPQVFVKAEDFALDKAAETFGNLAVKSYNEFKNNAPVIAIENMFQGMAFAKGEQMAELVEKSRQKFIDKMVDSKKMSKNEAKKIAEKQIGMTLDVGHLNLFKKTGFDDKDLENETKKMAPYVKHLHMTDNFGYEDTHLAPGMGNVPFKQILAKLEKEGRLDEMNKIIESGAFVAEFKKSPFPLTLAAMGSPIYGAKMESYWGDAQSSFGGYFSGYGTSNPSIHQSLYGSGFSTLPMEFGGKVAQNNSRFSGDSMS